MIHATYYLAGIKFSFQQPMWILMETAHDILSLFKLDNPAIDLLSAEAKKCSIGLGNKGVIKELLPTSWDLLDDISNNVWDSNRYNLEKIRLGFQLFELFPSYYHFLTPFYHALVNKNIIDPNELNIVWRQFMHYLTAENYFADPVAYVLWVDFFADQSTVIDCWRGLMSHRSEIRALRRLLEVVGPVPFELKEELYDSLISVQANHELIFLSLQFSAYDYYGKIDKIKAQVLLSKLVIDRENEKYKLLTEKLK